MGAQAAVELQATCGLHGPRYALHAAQVEPAEGSLLAGLSDHFAVFGTVMLEPRVAGVRGRYAGVVPSVLAVGQAAEKLKDSAADIIPILCVQQIEKQWTVYRLVDEF